MHMTAGHGCACARAGIPARLLAPVTGAQLLKGLPPTWDMRSRVASELPPRPTYDKGERARRRVSASGVDDPPTRPSCCCFYRFL